MHDFPILDQTGTKASADALGVCAWIKHQRMAIGMPKRTLCTTASVARSSLDHYEAGDVYPSVPVLVRIAAALGYDLVLRGIAPERTESEAGYIQPNAS